MPDMVSVKASITMDVPLGEGGKTLAAMLGVVPTDVTAKGQVTGSYPAPTPGAITETGSVEAPMSAGDVRAFFTNALAAIPADVKLRSIQFTADDMAPAS